MIDFKHEKLKRDLKDLIALRDQIRANRKSFHKLRDRITFWYYEKVMNILIPIGEFVIEKEEKDLYEQN